MSNNSTLQLVGVATGVAAITTGVVLLFVNSSRIPSDLPEETNLVVSHVERGKTTGDLQNHPDAIPLFDHSMLRVHAKRKGADEEAPFEITDVNAGVASDSVADPQKTASQPGEELRQAIVAGPPSAVPVLRAKLLAMGKDAVPVLKGLISSGDAPVEIEALRLLTAIGGDEAVAALLFRMMTLDADNPRFKEYQAVFANFHDPRVAAELVEFLGNANSDEVRLRVLMLLKDLKCETLPANLVNSFQKPVDGLHSSDCASAIAVLQYPVHVPGLEKIIRSSGTLELQKAALAGLANIGTQDACDILVYEAAAGETGQASALAAIPRIKSVYAQETLLNALWNHELPAKVRQAVVAALSHQADARVVTALQNEADGEPDAQIKSEIVKTLGTLAVDMHANAGAGTVSAVAADESCF